MSERYLIEIDRTPIAVDVCARDEGAGVAVVAAVDVHAPHTRSLTRALSRGGFHVVVAALAGRAEHDVLTCDTANQRLAHVLDVFEADPRFDGLPFVVVDAGVGGVCLMAATHHPRIRAVASLGAPTAVQPADIASLAAAVVLLVGAHDDAATVQHARELTAIRREHRLVLVADCAADAVGHAVTAWFQQRLAAAVDAYGICPGEILAAPA